MSYHKSKSFRYPDYYDTFIQSVNDRIFMCFPAGWIVGIFAGLIYSGFYWENLKPHLGTALLIGVTVALAVSYTLCCLTIRRILND